MESKDRSLVRAALAKSDWNEARRLLEHAKRTENDADWLALRAETAAGAGDLSYAASLYERVLALRPRDAAVLYNAALVLSELERHDEAVTLLEELVCVEGESSQVLEDLSYEHLESGHPVRAFLCAARAESIAANREERDAARYNAALALSAAGRKADALAWVERLLEGCSKDFEEREEAEALRDELRASK